MELNGSASAQPLRRGASIAQLISHSLEETTIKQDAQGNVTDGLAREFVQGNLEALAEEAELRKGRHGGQGLHFCTPLESFSVFGPSVYLYFQFLRKLIILLGVLSLLSLIPIVYNARNVTAYAPNAYGVTSAFAKTTIGAHLSSAPEQDTAKTVNVTIFTINIAVLLIFWLHWKKFTVDNSRRIQRELQLSSEGAAVIEVGEEGLEEGRLMAFLGGFGVVQELEKVVDLRNVLYYAKQIVELQTSNKLLERAAADAGAREHAANRIAQNDTRIAELREQLLQDLQQLRESDEVVLRYFVKFDSHESLQHILEKLSVYEGCCAPMMPEELLVGGKKLQLTRQNCQPYEIHWENQSASWKDSFLPHVLLLVLVNLAVVAALIAIALLLAAARPLYYQPALPSGPPPLSQTQLDSRCLAGDSEEGCESVYSLYQLRMAIHVAIGLVLVIARAVIREVVLRVRGWLRLRDRVEESLEVVMHLLINYAVVSVLIALSLQTSLFGSALVSIFISCVQAPSLKQNLLALLQYEDYTAQWYLDYGFQLAVNLLLMGFLPHCLAPLLHCLRAKLQFLAARQEKYAVLMRKALEVPHFELEDHYASLLNLLLAGLVFAAAVPVMLPLLWVGVAVRLCVDKLLFLHHTQPPLLSGRGLANKIPPIFLFAITAYVLNGIWAFGVESVFAPASMLFSDRGINIDSNAHNPFEALLVFLRRLASTWQPAMAYVLGVVAIIVRKLFLKAYCRQSEGKGKGSGIRESGSGIRSSYLRERNEDYCKVVDYIHSLHF